MKSEEFKRAKEMEEEALMAALGYRIKPKQPVQHQIPPQQQESEYDFNI